MRWWRVDLLVDHEQVVVVREVKRDKESAGTSATRGDEGLSLSVHAVSGVGLDEGDP